VGRQTVDYVANIYKYYVAYSLARSRATSMRRRIAGMSRLAKRL
jgi:hypothetical protein